MYQFTVPSYNAGGGDGYPKLDVVDTGNVDAAVLKDDLESLQTIAVANYEPQGEIVYTNTDVPNFGGCKINTPQ
ncbi:hypothetical protein AK965_05365 [Vibrio sp. PID17_43]|nr:hypothetical protein AK965_05365 [Vibrio sp. PID17_43]